MMRKSTLAKRRSQLLPVTTTLKENISKELLVTLDSSSGSLMHLTAAQDAKETWLVDDEVGCEAENSRKKVL